MLVAGKAWATESLSPRVIGLYGHLEVDYTIVVQVANLDAWADDRNIHALVPFIDGQPIRGNYPLSADARRGRLIFHLGITEESEPTWHHLLGAPERMDRDVTFSVGPEDGSAFDTAFERDRRVSLTVISEVYGAIALGMVLTMLLVFLWLSRTTGIIRRPGPRTIEGSRRPYDLGRFQMAFWFFLVYASYACIWLITDAADTITPSLLALMGISAGTALGEAAIEAGREERLHALRAERAVLAANIETPSRARRMHAAETPASMHDASNVDALVAADRVRLAQVEVRLDALASSSADFSRGFLRDLLSDGDNYRFDRFQIFAFTLILGVIFVSSVYNSLSMPEFSPTLLALMGLSSGTYIGFKFPDQK
jgi:hypothetical protein